MFTQVLCILLQHYDTQKLVQVGTDKSTGQVQILALSIIRLLFGWKFRLNRKGGMTYFTAVLFEIGLLKICIFLWEQQSKRARLGDCLCPAFNTQFAIDITGMKFDCA